MCECPSHRLILQQSNLDRSQNWLSFADETRVIFKARPLGIQIKPVNIHGFGAKISKVNDSVQHLGIRQNMIITGLNNKDLLGCTFDQIMNIIRSASLPITLRLKSINHTMAMAKPQKYTHKKLHKTMMKPTKNKNNYKTHKRTDIPTPTTAKTALMLQSFSAENICQFLQFWPVRLMRNRRLWTVQILRTDYRTVSKSWKYVSMVY